MMQLARFMRFCDGVLGARRHRPARTQSTRVEPLEPRQLLAGAGLAGYYFAGTDFTQIKHRRTDPQLSFNWQGTPHTSIPSGPFGVHWSAKVTPRYSETYRFYARTTGGVRVWVNNQLIIDDPSIHAAKDNKGTIALKANTQYDLRVEYFDTGSGSLAQLHWASTKQAREVIPSSRLSAPDLDTTAPGAATNLRATYITDRAFKFWWNAVPDGATPVVYDVWLGSTRFGATTALNYIRGSLNPNTNYSMTVRTVDWAGNYSSSQRLTIRTRPAVADGNGVGLAAKYYGSENFSLYRLTRTDPVLNFGTANLPFESGPDEPLSARWSGNILPKYDEVYTFTISADAGVRLWVGGRLIIDQWSATAPAQHTGNMTLRAGQSYSFRLEYRHAQGAASLQARWQSLSTKPALIPSSQMFPAFVDQTAPSTPTNLGVETATPSELTVRWNPASDDVGIVRYDVFRDGEMIGSTTSPVFADDGLAPDTTYDYTVSTVDGAARTSPPSPILAARTAAPPARNATGVLPAVDYNATAGASRLGNVITSLDDGDWVKYDRLDFGSTAVRSWRVKLGASVAGAGGRIELRLDSPNGQLIGTHIVQPTGSYVNQYWQQVETSAITGIRDLYLVFDGGSSVANIEAFQFSTKQLVRIMPLGDSITASNPSYNSYRYYLWQKLLAGGYAPNFVGSQLQNASGPAANLNFDQNHEGHVAMRADQVLAQAAGWVNAANPSIVLLHIGTNDIMLGQSPSGVVGEVGQIIDAIRSVKPNMKFVVAQILPIDGFDAEVAAFNAGIATLVANKTSGSSPVRLADMNSGFSSSDKYDGVHPNDTGESKMADRWYDVLATLLA